ncbi:hypothetical protein M3Y99_00897500 [Aphelenchoides fujianensis]|nr:hypothetical protein M3Y99_00897500 [Aphelenchoides fujianensis]
MQHPEFATLEFAPERPPADGDAEGEEVGEGELLMDDHGNTREGLRTLYRKHEFVFPRNDEDGRPWSGPKPNPADSNQILAFGLIIHMEGSRLFVFTSSDGQSRHEVREFRAPYPPPRRRHRHVPRLLVAAEAFEQSANEDRRSARTDANGPPNEGLQAARRPEAIRVSALRQPASAPHRRLLAPARPHRRSPSRRLDVYRQQHADVDNDPVYNVEYVVRPEMRDGRLCGVSTRIVGVHGSIDHRVDLPKELSYRQDEPIQRVLPERVSSTCLLHSPEELEAKEEERKLRRRDQEIAYNQRYLNMGNFQDPPPATAIRDASGHSLDGHSGRPPSSVPLRPLYSDADTFGRRGPEATLPPSTHARRSAVQSPANNPVGLRIARLQVSRPPLRRPSGRLPPTLRRRRLACRRCADSRPPSRTEVSRTAGRPRPPRQSPHASAQRNGFQQPPPQQQPNASTSARRTIAASSKRTRECESSPIRPTWTFGARCSRRSRPKSRSSTKNKAATIFITYSTNGNGVLFAKQYLRDGYNVVIHADDVNADKKKIQQRFPSDLIKDHNFMLVKGYLSESFAVKVVDGVLAKFHRLDAILHSGCALCKPGRRVIEDLNDANIKSAYFDPELSKILKEVQFEEPTTITDIAKIIWDFHATVDQKAIDEKRRAAAAGAQERRNGAPLKPKGFS